MRNNIQNSNIVWFFAWEAGSADVLSSLADLLIERGFVIRIVAFSPAIKVFEHKGFDAKYFLNVNLIFKDSFLKKNKPSLIISGLGIRDRRPECWTTWYKLRKISPTLSILDNYKGLDRYFTHDGLQGDWLPDSLIVMDEIIRQELLSMGLRDIGIFSDGHPGLESFSNRPKQWRYNLHKKTRRSLGINNDTRVILLASEIVHEHGFFGKCTKNCTGLFFCKHNEESLWMHINKREKDQNVIFIMRPHPNESLIFNERESLIFNERFRTVSFDEQDDISLLSISDHVYGLSSMMVLKAVEWGIDTTNLQPLLHSWDPSLSFHKDSVWKCLVAKGMVGRFIDQSSYSHDSIKHNQHSGAAFRIVNRIVEIIQGN